MSFDNLMGYILSISMCMQNFITIFHSVQEIAPLSLFQNLELGKASTNEKCHFAISWARSCQYQCLRKSFTIFLTIQEIGPFSLFQNLELGKASTDKKNVSSQSLGLDLFNIKLSAKFYQNIPNCLRVKFHFFFRIWTSAKPRPIPNVIWLSHGLHHININVYAKFHHNIPLSSREKCHFAISWARSCQYQCLRKSLSKYSTQFKR